MAAKWIGELADRHKGEAGFLIGNGWTANFYDIAKMKNEGVLIGCNESFQKFPLDYLIWQDKHMDDICMSADCIKLPSIRRNKKPLVESDRDDIYYWGFGRRSINGALVLNSSGGCALQMLHWMGCNPVILVGCDCMMIPDKSDRKLHSNIFKDKQARFEKTSRVRNIIVNGHKVMSTKRLMEFVDEFEGWERRLTSTQIYKMGDFGAVDIHHVEFPELQTDMHPDRKKI